MNKVFSQTQEVLGLDRMFEVDTTKEIGRGGGQLTGMSMPVILCLSDLSRECNDVRTTLVRTSDLNRTRKYVVWTSETLGSSADENRGLT